MGIWWRHDRDHPSIFMYFFREPNGEIKPIQMADQQDSSSAEQKAQA